MEGETLEDEATEGVGRKEKVGWCGIKAPDTRNKRKIENQLVCVCVCV